MVVSVDRLEATAAEAAELKALAAHCPLVLVGRARAQLAPAAGAIALDASDPSTVALLAELARRESSRRSDDPSPT